MTYLSTPINAYLGGGQKLAPLLGLSTGQLQEAVVTGFSNMFNFALSDGGKLGRSITTSGTTLVGVVLARFGEVKTPRQPTLLSGKAPVDDEGISALLTWQTQPDITEYQVILSETTTAHGPAPQSLGWLASGTRVDDLKPASEYEVTLKAIGPKGMAETAMMIHTPPPEPGLAVTDTTHESIRLSPDTGEALPLPFDFQVEWRPKLKPPPGSCNRFMPASAQSRWETIRVPGDASHISLTGLSAATEYEIRVRTISKHGQSKWTCIDAVTTSE